MAEQAHDSNRRVLHLLPALLGGLTAVYGFLVIGSVTAFIAKDYTSQEFAHDIIWPLIEFTMWTSAALFVGCVIGAIVRRRHNP